MASVSISKTVLLLVFIVNSEAQHVQRCPALRNESWSYSGQNGPSSWGDKYPTCNGLIQSPIAINTSLLIKDPELPKLALNGYDFPVTKASIQNNGHTVQVTPLDNVPRTIYVNGSTYALKQIHFHWGERIFYGSEHIIDQFPYAMEAHFVHENMKKNIAVVAVFFQEQIDMRNEDLRPIIELLSQVTYKDATTRLRSYLNLNSILPANPSSIYLYLGSLTTPDCKEGVIWSLLPKPQIIGSVQMAEFRKLYSVKQSEANSNCKLSDNFRPVQPLNYRTVFASH